MMPTENMLVNRKGTEVTKPARKCNVFLLPFLLFVRFPYLSLPSWQVCAHFGTTSGC